MSSNHEQLITKISNQFKKQLHRDTDHDEVPNILREVLMNFQNELMGKRRSRRQAKTSDGPKKTNWQAVWTSNSVGCRAYPDFKTQLEKIVKENPDLDRFNVNKRLRQWADGNGKYNAWKDWARAQLEAEGKPVPQDKVEKKEEKVDKKVDKKVEKKEEKVEKKEEKAEKKDAKPKLAEQSADKPVPKDVQMKGKSAGAKGKGKATKA